ncbi:type I restriction endonuclease subunit M [Roseateles flavus]|uniref:Type I restriction endonuclease subunit M n=1 Tax=Roseateles flavus TaxID=3149041 RepID=A0ABV0GLG4_9BURK
MTDSKKAVAPPHGRFKLGSLTATPGALALLQRLGVLPLSLLLRHARGDFGELGAEDLTRNEEAIAMGFRVFSAYSLVDVRDPSKVHRCWVITEADRSVTTLLLPEEY